jgi:hypothetical protein
MMPCCHGQEYRGDPDRTVAIPTHSTYVKQGFQYLLAITIVWIWQLESMLCLVNSKQQKPLRFPPVFYTNSLLPWFPFTSWSDETSYLNKYLDIHFQSNYMQVHGKYLSICGIRSQN